jgi:hypothetical protein
MSRRRRAGARGVTGRGCKGGRSRCGTLPACARRHESDLPVGESRSGITPPPRVKEAERLTDAPDAASEIALAPDDCHVTPGAGDVFARVATTRPGGRLESHDARPDSTVPGASSPPRRDSRAGGLLDARIHRRPKDPSRHPTTAATARASRVAQGLALRGSLYSHATRRFQSQFGATLA